MLRRNVIKSFISLIYKQMERDNSFLQKGGFPFNDYNNRLETYDAFNIFILFIENSYLEYNSKKEKIFKEGVLKELVSKIYEAIDKTKEENSITNNSLKVSKEDAIEIIKLQRKFLNDFNKYYYKFYSQEKEIVLSEHERIDGVINYMPFSKRLSSGENALLNFFSRIYNFLNSNLKKTKFRKLNEHYVLLLDEADLTFHPSWKKRYVKLLIETLPYFFNELENKPSFEIIFTTHDPLALSDLPNSNVIYIERKDYNSSPSILNHNDINRPHKTFGANISDLIADSFFVENSLIGDFVFKKINETIKWLNDDKDNINAEYFKKIIRIIDEPIIQRKLAEMYDDKMQSNFHLSIINEQIKKLEELKSKLEK